MKHCILWASAAVAALGCGSGSGVKDALSRSEPSAGGRGNDGPVIRCDDNPVQRKYFECGYKGRKTDQCTNLKGLTKEWFEACGRKQFINADCADRFVDLVSGDVRTEDQEMFQAFLAIETGKPAGDRQLNFPKFPLVEYCGNPPRRMHELAVEYGGLANQRDFVPGIKKMITACLNKDIYCRDSLENKFIDALWRFGDPALAPELYSLAEHEYIDRLQQARIVEILEEWKQDHAVALCKKNMTDGPSELFLRCINYVATLDVKDVAEQIAERGEQGRFREAVRWPLLELSHSSYVKKERKRLGGKKAKRLSLKANLWLAVAGDKKRWKDLVKELDGDSRDGRHDNVAQGVKAFALVRKQSFHKRALKHVKGWLKRAKKDKPNSSDTATIAHVAWLLGDRSAEKTVAAILKSDNQGGVRRARQHAANMSGRAMIRAMKSHIASLDKRDKREKEEAMEALSNLIARKRFKENN